MSRDYKAHVQECAEELAEMQYRRSFSDLTDQQQYEIYAQARDAALSSLLDQQRKARRIS